MRREQPVAIEGADVRRERLRLTRVRGRAAPVLGDEVGRDAHVVAHNGAQQRAVEVLGAERDQKLHDAHVRARRGGVQGRIKVHFLAVVVQEAAAHRGEVPRARRVHEPTARAVQIDRNDFANVEAQGRNKVREGEHRAKGDPLSGFFVVPLYAHNTQVSLPAPLLTPPSARACSAPTTAPMARPAPWSARCTARPR